MAIKKKISRSAQKKQQSSIYWREVAKQRAKQSQYYAALIEEHGAVIVLQDGQPSHPIISYSGICKKRGAIVIK